MESKLLGREVLPFLAALAASALLFDAILHLLGAAWSAATSVFRASY